MNIQRIPMEKLKPSAYNPRKDLKPGDKEYDDLKKSITEFGYVEPIIWNEQTLNVVGGHQRLKILMDLGYTEAECVVIDLPPEKEKTLNIALNKIQGAWDETKLAELIEELDKTAVDLELTGFSKEEIEDILNSWHAHEAKQDDFDVDKAHAEISAKGAVTKEGDIWLLGEHRLMCGDSTSDDDMSELMEGRTAQMCVTSPPYGVGKEYEKKGIEPWFETIKPVIKNICRYANIVCWNIGDLLATGSQFIEPTSAYSINMFRENGFNCLWVRVWKKQGLNFGVSPYHLVTNKPVQQYEYISAFSKDGDEEYNDQEYVWLSAFANHSYRFVKRLTKQERKQWGYAGIWQMNTVRANKEHPAMFPVELPWRCIKMHSDKGAIILEPFCGAGTAIIAAEQLERRCYGMEISPVYCDLAVRRWEEFTGKQAILKSHESI